MNIQGSAMKIRLPRSYGGLTCCALQRGDDDDDIDYDNVNDVDDDDVDDDERARSTSCISACVSVARDVVHHQSIDSDRESKPPRKPDDFRLYRAHEQQYNVSE